MTIKEILHQSLMNIFSGEIEDEYFLFVKRDSGNMLIGGSQNGVGKIRIKGMMTSLEDFSLMDPETIKALAVISKHVTYWFKIVDKDSLEIRSSSNLLGRSGLTLLKIKRMECDKWVVEENRFGDVIPEDVVFKDSFEMAQFAFDILADYGNPYKRDEEILCDRYYPNDILIDIERGALYVNGNVWFPFPDF